jgi:hypothetical protein
MSELKTKKNDDSVEAFIDSLEHEQRRADAVTLLTIFEKGDSDATKTVGQEHRGVRPIPL